MNNMIDFLEDTLRHKLYVLLSKPGIKNSLCNCLQSQGINIIDLGYELALELIELKRSLHFDLIPNKIEALIEKKSILLPGMNHKTAAIENLGILLEPALRLNCEKLLAEISKNTHLIILWSDSVSEKNVLQWSTLRDKYNFDLTSYHQKIIDYTNEI